VPDPSVAPIRVLSPSSDGESWTVTLDGVPVNSGVAATAEDAQATAVLVAVSCVVALNLLGLSARVEPTE
jgi:hypothetical protein